MNEIWKDIPGYESKYQVSNLGNVRSLNYLRTGGIKLLTQGTDKRGYKRVGLYKDGKRKRYLVHRLVAMTFISNYDDLPQVNHKDENKANNCVDNLEWCDAKYNMNYGTRNERASESHKGKKGSWYGKQLSEEHKKKISKGLKDKKSKPILMYDREGNFIRRFDSTADANEYFGKDRKSSSIYLCLTERNKTAYNYIFKYENEENKNKH